MTDSANPLDSFDLEALDEFLSSDAAPPDSMMLSDLDGFLTGIAIGPELILPSEWLPVVWGGGSPAFASKAEAETVIGAIMARYNEILREIDASDFEPIFWEREGTVIASDWAEGFLEAMSMRLTAWQKLMASETDSRLLVPILALCGNEDGESLLGINPEDEDAVMAEAGQAIPDAVIAIAAYWREAENHPAGDTPS